MSALQEIDVKKLSMNPFSLIGDEWMLVSTGNAAKCNTMTASWGGLGVLWGKNVAYSVIRPQRYTFELLEENDAYTLSFYPPECKKALALCGKVSGRDVDKFTDSGLTPCFDLDAPYFEEAKLVLCCRKLYGQFLDPACFLDASLEGFYPDKDYHKLYVGEIVKALARE